MPVDHAAAPRNSKIPDRIKDRIAELAATRARILAGPSERVQAQNAKGKLTARERIDLLLDEGSFNEAEPLRRHRATGFRSEDNNPYTA
jgi:methylmalonyl-CoA decarboxylase subunit alpha